MLALWLLAAAADPGPVDPGPADPGPRRVVIASKNFTESHLLGEVMAQLLRAHTDLEVEHRSGLGGTLVCFEALRGGEVDVYPDYTGTGWSIVLKEPEKITDPLRAFLHVQAEYRARYDVEWLQPFGLNNTYALAVTAELADELGLRTISDLAPHAGRLKAAFSIEFTNREDGYPGLGPFYGLAFERVAAMEHGLAYEALAAGDVDVIDAYSTDGKLLRYGLRVLEDDRHFFPPYDAAPLVRGAFLRAAPEVGEVLENLAFRLSDERMTQLNYEVEVEGRSFEAVARGFLEEQGLLAPSGADPDGERPRTGFWAFFLGRWRETLSLVARHLVLTGWAVGLATLMAVPLGIAITRSRWGERLSLGAAGVVQTVPSLALLAFMIAIPGLGLSARSAVVALTLYAVLPILRNTFAGLCAVDPALIDAARGLGLTERQILLRVQLPLATGTIMAGVRTATVVTIGFATLAAFIGAGGLGEPIVTGLYLNDPALILSGALPAAALALAADALLGRIERALVPRGLRG